MPGANQEVHAQNQGSVTLTTHVGFAGNCKENRWIPIRVMAENKGADLNGRIQVAYKNSNGGQSGYAVELSLPSTSRKEFFIYLYPDNYLTDLRVDLMVGDHVVETTPLKVTCIANESLIIGLLTDTPSAFSALGKLTAPNGYTRVVPLQLVDLPDQPQGWEGLDALVVSGMDTGALTDQQRNALKIWLAQGGKLLIAGGPKWQSTTSGLTAFLPLDLNKTTTISDLSALQQYYKSAAVLDAQSVILAVGQPNPKASVLIAQDGVPVLAQKQVGFGNVYYLAADPSLQPLSTWADMGKLYENLLKTPSARPSWTTANWETSAANQALAAMPALGLPPTLYVLCLLGVYILVIGPINYLILRAIKRQEWAWITIPGFVILFTLVAYLSGYWIRGTRPLLNRLAVVQAWDDVDLADARALVGIYSPGRTKYTLQAGESFLPHPFDSSSQSLQADQGWLSLQQGSQRLLPDVLVESSGMKSALMNGSVPAIAIADNLVVTLYAGNPILSGSITNNSKYTLKNATLITPDNAKDLGDLPPGATRNTQISMTSQPKGLEIYDFQANAIYTNYSDGQLDDKVVRESALMRTTLANGQSGNKVTAGIYLTGWLEDDILQASVQGQGFDTINTTFYMLNLSPSVKLQPGDIRLTPALFTWTTSDPAMTPYLQNDYPPPIPENGYVLNFKLATPLAYNTVKSLSLNLNHSTYTSSAAPPNTVATFSLWNWETASWVQFDASIWGDNGIPEPAGFVGPGGEIRLKISKANNSTQDPNPIGSSYFTLVVQP